MARIPRSPVDTRKELSYSSVSNSFSSVLRDIHFWVPTIVLIAGLVLLRWVS
jgi:hypothetical protein